MAQADGKQFSGVVKVFHERRLPEAATPAGYGALIDAYKLDVPVPITLSAIAQRHKTLSQDGWQLYTPRHAPEATLQGHLTFALKYEGLDLAVLKRLFLATGPAPIKDFVEAAPSGKYTRRLWFLYEWLTGTRLDMPDLKKVAYVDWARVSKRRIETPKYRHRAGSLPREYPPPGG